MKPPSRNLVFGMHGADVRELQRDLVWLGFDILSPEITSGRFGESTRAAVQALQKQNRLAPEGVADSKTVEVIDRKLRDMKRVVRGNVLRADGQPLSQTMVRVFDKDLRKETKLGEAACDAAGYFEIKYAFNASDKSAPNLLVKGFATARATEPVAISEVMFNARPEVIINLVAGETKFRGLSEFERLMKDIKPLVENQGIKVAELSEDEKNKDITFLSRQTPHSVDRIIHAVLSHRYETKSGLQPEVLYAWLRQGLPTEPSALLSQDSLILRRALVQAVKDNVIPQGFETEAKLQATLEALKAWRASVALEEPPDSKQMTLGKLVKSVLSEANQQQRFMFAYAEHSGSVEEFWKKLDRDAQLAPRAAELKFAVLVGNLGQDHLPLVDAVRRTSRLKELKDLAGLSEDGWYALITEEHVGTPPGVEGADDAERTHRYARSLANAVEAALPTEFFVARLKETDVAGKTDLLKFFQANPSFDIKETRLETFLKDNPDALRSMADPKFAVNQLKALGRTYRLAAGFRPAMALQQAGKDSAHRISRMGQNAFVASFGQYFDDAAQARQVHAKARQVSDSAVALVADVNPAMNRVALHAVPDTVANAVAEIPTWSTLFGSLDSCSCEQCQSVYSPAAYFVDLLNFLEDREARPAEAEELPPLESTSVKDVLFARRPDLGEIELTCENTNTVMPYVDLVLEILEDAVAPPPAFTPFEIDSDRITDLDQGKVSAELRAAFTGTLSDHATIRIKRPGEWWVVDDLSFSYCARLQPDGNPKFETRSRQSWGTQLEGAANSQYINRQAYATLKEARFPWSLPFDQSLLETRTYLGHLGVARHELMEACIAGDRPDVLGNNALAHEFLGLSSTEAALIGGPTPATPWEQWGFSEELQGGVAWLETLGIVSEFLLRSGLEYRELLDLLETQYINGGHVLRIVSNDPGEPESCEIEKLALLGPNADIASRVVRFVRLWRKLGWPVFDVDRVIRALGGELTPGFLLQLSHLSKLQQRFNLPVSQLSTLWAPLDTVRYTNQVVAGKPAVPSLYDQLFRSRESINPLDPAFPEDAAALTGKLIDHADAIAAALEVGAADLSALIQCAKVFPPGIEIALDLNNLSGLYRHVFLAKAVKLPMPDYLTALELIDGAPFTDATRTVLFVESVARVKTLGFRFAELNYLFRHQNEASSGIALEERVIVDHLRELRQALQKSATREAVARKLAETFRLEMRPLSLLEPQWVSLMDPALAHAADQALNADNFPQQFADLVRLHKISVIVARSSVGTDMLEWLLSHDIQGLLDLRTLPAAPAYPDFSKWMRLINLLALRPAFFGGEQSLLELLELAHKDPAPSQDELLNQIVQKTNWNRADLAFLVAANGFALTLPDDFKSEKALLRLVDCFAILKRLGISAEQAKNFSEDDVTPEMARAVRRAVRAKYDDSQWAVVAKPLRDVFREKQRSALVAFLIARGAALDANGLYGHFLIDVEMDPCMMTSRIKQAISSVQLFVQRCLMSLESEVLTNSTLDDAWNWWKWMKNYRVWEANRKVFLYPENWIEPELRDDKSPFFKELESELLESDLTLETAKAAFLNYLEKLDQVARLDVMGVYHQKDGEFDILHVFARTQAPPRVYYYRRRVNSAYWTPWEKVDLDIEGDHLIPILWNSRLYLFWPMFMEKADSSTVAIPPLAQGGPLRDETRRYWEMKLAWSERKQGQWTSKKISSQSAKIEQQTSPRLGAKDGQLADLSKVFFIPVVQGHDLSIEQAFVTTRNDLEGAFSGGIFDTDVMSNGVFDPDLDDGQGTTSAPDSFVVGSHNMFFFEGCYSDPKITPHGSGSLVIVPDALPGTTRSYMGFLEKEEAALNLPLHRNLAGSVAALALTPGQYRVTSQGAEVRVTRNPFFFQDPSRSFLVIPKLSWWDDSFMDPGEVGGALATEQRVTTSSASAAGHGVAAPGSSSTADISSVLSAGEAALATQLEAALGPDRHFTAPFARHPNTKYTFHNFYHPYVCALISIFNRQGLDQMLRREVQLKPYEFRADNGAAAPFAFEALYVPSNDLIAPPLPTEEMDFGFSGSYALYNWELFFHAPLLIADRLTKNQRFEDAAKWFHYIFNPSDTSSEPVPQRYWQTKDFFGKTSQQYQQERTGSLFKLLAKAPVLRHEPNPTQEQQEDLQRLDDLQASIKAWRSHPFKPHLIARTRTTAYQKTVVMKYIDNLIAWGDQLFRRDTIESINEATQLYVMAADILGARPVEVTPQLTARVQTYNSLGARVDDFANALVEVEELIPVDADPGVDGPEQHPPTLLYFCLPRNDKLLGYWDTVADRLFKIRHCMNIEGVVRQLPLFEPPIDPALLVRGIAAGVDLNSLINDVEMPVPEYRFNVWAQKANELCGEVRSIGATFLATLEKRDAEDLSLLRARHETGLLEVIELVRQQQLEEAAEQLEVLSASRSVILGRLSHYQRLLGEGDAKPPAVGERVQEKDDPRFSEIQTLAGIKMFPHEVLENVLLTAAQGLEVISALRKHFGAVLYAFPEVNTMPMGMGTTQSGFGDVQNAAADGTSRLASVAQVGANMLSRLGSYIVRELDWVLQHNQAARELFQLDKQFLGAQIRREIAQLELQNHRRQMDNALQVEEFMRDKYTNKELYSWMVGQMSGVYFQAYQLAYDAAKRAEKCYHHELGIKEPSWIQFGYWDSLKKGLMAGERLHHDLKRMEIAYLELSRREFELTKHVSLAQIAPLELVRLRETGRCSLRLPEELFDLDYPGHYFRRIKSVSVTFPCVLGSYTTVSCTLRMSKNSVRIDTTNGNNGYPRNTDTLGLPADDTRFVENNTPIRVIATSSGQNDSGVFELSFRDERYLPFEGTGVISEWSLELFNDPTSPDFGRSLRQFDYDSISDVVLHVKYSAREDAGEFKNSATAHLREYFRDVATPTLLALDLRRDFGTPWSRFRNPTNPGNGNVFEFEISPTLFPVRDAGKTLKIHTMYLLARCTDAGDYGVTLTSAQAGTNAMTLVKSGVYGGLHFGVITASVEVAPAGPPASWSIRVTRPGGGNLTEDPVKKVFEVEDVIFVLGYQWK